MGEEEIGFGVEDGAGGTVLDEVAGEALGGEEGMVGFLEECVEGGDPIGTVRGEDDGCLGAGRQGVEVLDKVFEEGDLGFGVEAEFWFLDVQGEEARGEAAEFELGLLGGDLAADEVVKDCGEIVAADVFLEVVAVGQPMCTDGDGCGSALAGGGACEFGACALGGVNEFDLAAATFAGGFEREAEIIERVFAGGGIVERLFPEFVGLGEVGIENPRLQGCASALPGGDEVTRVRQESQLHEGADGVLGREGCLHAGKGDRARGVFFPVERVDDLGVAVNEVRDVYEACVGLFVEVKARASRPRNFYRLADDVHLGDVAHHGQDFER